MLPIQPLGTPASSAARALRLPALARNERRLSSGVKEVWVGDFFIGFRRGAPAAGKVARFVEEIGPEKPTCPRSIGQRAIGNEAKLAQLPDYPGSFLGRG